jgi:hypothetical protein
MGDWVPIFAMRILGSCGMGLAVELAVDLAVELAVELAVDEEVVVAAFVA